MAFKKLFYGLISQEKLFCLMFFSGVGIYYCWEYILYNISFEFNFYLLMAMPLISIGAIFFSILLKDVMRIWAKIDLQDKVMIDAVSKKKVTAIFFRSFTSVHFFFFLMINTFLLNETPVSYLIISISSLVYILIIILLMGIEFLPFQGRKVTEVGNVFKRILTVLFFVYCLAYIIILSVMGVGIKEVKDQEALQPRNAFDIINMDKIIVEDDIKEVNNIAAIRFFESKINFLDGYIINNEDFDYALHEDANHVYEDSVKCTVVPKPFSTYWSFRKEKGGTIKSYIIICFKEVSSGVYEILTIKAGSEFGGYYEKNNF